MVRKSKEARGCPCSCPVLAKNQSIFLARRPVTGSIGFVDKLVNLGDDDGELQSPLFTFVPQHPLSLALQACQNKKAARFLPPRCAFSRSSVPWCCVRVKLRPPARGFESLEIIVDKLPQVAGQLLGRHVEHDCVCCLCSVLLLALYRANGPILPMCCDRHCNSPSIQRAIDRPIVQYRDTCDLAARHSSSRPFRSSSSRHTGVNLAMNSQRSLREQRRRSACCASFDGSS